MAYQFDPSIISAIPDMAGDPVGSMEKGIGIADALDKQQLNKLHLGQEQRSEKEDQQVQAILKNSKYDTPEGLADTASKVNKVSPRSAMDLLKKGQEYQSGKVSAELDQLSLLEKRQDLIVGAIDPIVAQAREMKSKGASDLDVKAFISQQMPQAINQLRGMQLPDGKPALPDDQLKMATSIPGGYTLATLEGWEAKSKQGAAAIKARLEQMKGDTAQKAEQTRETHETEVERHDREMEKKGTGGEAKPPAGFEWAKNPDGTPKLDENGQPEATPIKGGPKDPTGSAMSGRQAIMFTRVASSANEAAAAIKNITELPVGASSGVFGVGGGPGHGLFASAKGALTNKMADQDVQDYNTMLAGVKRNLATIESAGLAPSGALTENFASLELRSGDTQMTKLRKLAEMRQIIEKGIEVNLDDPHVPPPQKELVRKIIKQVTEAVPYTQSDVTALQRAQRKNPDLTLEQLIGKQGLGGDQKSPGAAPPSGSASPAPGGGAAPAGPLPPGHATGGTGKVINWADLQ